MDVTTETTPYTTAPDGTCPVVSPVARWLKDFLAAHAWNPTLYGVAPLPESGTTEPGEFRRRLNALARLLDSLATHANALAYGEGWAADANPSAGVFASLDRIAAAALGGAINGRRLTEAAARADTRFAALANAAHAADAAVALATKVTRAVRLAPLPLAARRDAEAKLARAVHCFLVECLPVADV